MEERDKIVIGALKACTSREFIEDTFERYGITDTQERIDKLNRCMGDPQTFFTPDKVSLEETYDLTIRMFLTMSWKLNDIYDRMGLAAPNVSRKSDYISNTRIRPDNVDIFDWLLSKDADMSKTPEGRQIIAALQSLDN